MAQSEFQAVIGAERIVAEFDSRQGHEEMDARVVPVLKCPLVLDDGIGEQMLFEQVVAFSVQGLGSSLVPGGYALLPRFWLRDGTTRG